MKPGMHIVEKLAPFRDRVRMLYTPVDGGPREPAEEDIIALLALIDEYVKYYPDGWKYATQMDQLRAKAEDRERVLLAAIRQHRDEKGHGRCWLDDVRLYAVLLEAVGVAPLPPREEFLKACSVYYETRNPTP